MHLEDLNDRDQIEQMLALILAIDIRWMILAIMIDFSQYLAPSKKKS